MRNKGAFATFAVALALFCPLLVPQVMAQGLLSHRAVYDLVSGRIDPSSNIGEISGRLVVEAIEECDGYILNQRIVTRLSGSEGGETVNDFRMAIWESRDGRSLRFNILDYVDGGLIQEDDGQAKLSRADGAGRAEFTSPEGMRMELPAGTVFPMAHNLLVLRSAREGRRTVPVVVFDGSSEGGFFDTYTVIGNRHENSAEAARGQSALRGIGFWRIRTGYFPKDSKAAEPEFEIGYNLFDNGVAGDMTLDYGNFVIAGALKSIEKITTPACTE